MILSIMRNSFNWLCWRRCGNYSILLLCVCLISIIILRVKFCNVINFFVSVVILRCILIFVMMSVVISRIWMWFCLRWFIFLFLSLLLVLLGWGCFGSNLKCYLSRFRLIMIMFVFVFRWSIILFFCSFDFLFFFLVMFCFLDVLYLRVVFNMLV